MIKKKRSLSQMYLSGVSPIAFFCGKIFAWGTHSHLGAEKPPLIQILPLHLKVKSKNETKTSLSQMHPSGAGPAVFLGGTHSRLEYKNLL